MELSFGMKLREGESSVTPQSFSATTEHSKVHTCRACDHLVIQTNIELTDE